jgi:hypothetical protein
MSNVEEIVAAVNALNEGEFACLRKKLDRIEQQRWEAGRRAASERLREAGIGDRKIDEIIMRRRRESRT